MKRFKIKMQRILVKYGKHILPEPIRKRLFIKSLKYPKPISKDLIFKVAETREEFSQAFSLIYREYLKLGYIDTNDSGYYYKIYHALPESTVLIAKRGNQVIGIISLIRDNEWGLPLESCFDLNEDTAKTTKNKRIAEVCSFVIDTEFRRTANMDISFYMMKFLHEYSREFLNTSYLFAAITPHHFDFYKFFFGFQKWNKNEKMYMGAPAMTCYLDIKEASKRMAAMFGYETNQKSMTHFYFVENVPNFKFPKRPYYKITDNYMSAEDVDYFFNQKSDLFQKLSREKLELLYFKYNHIKVIDVLPRLKPKPEFIHRSPRFEVECRGKVVPISDQVIQIHDTVIKNVSRSGLKFVGANLNENTPVVLRIEIADMVVAKVTGKIVNISQSGHLSAIKVDQCCKNWRKYIDFLEMNSANKSWQVNGT